jgi:flagellar protein FlaJ
MRTDKKLPEPKVPFLFVTPEFCHKKLKRLKGLGKTLSELFPNLKENLGYSGLNTMPEYYTISALLSSFIISTFFAILMYILASSQDHSITKVILLTFMSFFVIILLLFLIFIKYPGILKKKKAGEINKHLMFAVKDLLLHTSAGSSFFEAMYNISKSNYGEVSIEFSKVVKKINTNTPTLEALEMLSNSVESDYLKKVLWQLINTLKAGGDLKQSLDAIVNDLITMQRSNIIGYANELNLWSLIYMLFAVAAPTIGMTMMIILSSFADVGINETVLIIFIGITMVIQLIIIVLIKSRRPMVEF